MSQISVNDVFTIGIGPSSSHTVGPMRAARRFIKELKELELLEDLASLRVELYGSLAMTGKGHATDIAILLGLEGESPETVDPDSIEPRVDAIRESKEIALFRKVKIPFDTETDLLFLRGKRLPFHSNAIRFKAFDEEGKPVLTKVYYSIGGGALLDHEEAMAKAKNASVRDTSVPFPFRTAEELLAHAKREDKAIWEIVWENEISHTSPRVVRSSIAKIWQAMQTSIARGVRTRGILPGGLNVKRRAADLFDALIAQNQESPTDIFEWVSVYALAVNEENAAGSRVVTSPTNGSAGVIPAVLKYAEKYLPNFDDEKVEIFFLTATAIGILYKEGASISAAEMGCQGEIGVSSSMAAAGLAAIMGGTSEQIENAAEMAMEHHIGLTCDPPGGLVQIPCIERNTMGAIKAITAAKLALRGDGTHIVSLDAVIRAMKETGENMQEIYKETSEGGLALQVSVMTPAC